MGIFNFWKKKDDDLDFDKMGDENLTDMGKPLQDDLGLETPAMEQSASSPEHTMPTTPEMPSQEDAPKAPTGNVQDYSLPNRELELINSKLDTIKALLRSLDQRVANLEQVAGVEQKKEEHRLW